MYIHIHIYIYIQINMFVHVYVYSGCAHITHVLAPEAEWIDDHPPFRIAQN